MPHGLDGKVALVTGGGRNIGRQVCLSLAEYGCDVVVNVRANRTEAEAVAAEVRARGRRSLAIAADVSDEAAVAAMATRARNDLGPVRVLVNCATLLHHVLFADLTKAKWREMVGVVVEGPMNTARAVLPQMVEAGGGSIVNISGTVVFYGTWPHLAAAKAAIHGFTRGIAREYGPRGVRANVIVPSTVETIRTVPRDPQRVATELGRTPLGRFATTREIADVVAFLASDMSSFVTGQTIHVNGGQYMP